MSERPESAREALERRARSSPEEPFLFFRSKRGTFAWWSFARAATELRREPGPGSERDDPAQAVPAELVARLGAAPEAELTHAHQLVSVVGSRPDREIWISTRPLERRQESTLALASALAGWAIVREPAERLLAELLLWARPTLVSGDAGELVELFVAVLAEAPRRGRERWLARRLARLAIVLIEGGGAGVGSGEVGGALSALGVAPRQLPFPGGGW